jgi:hypothetical protein
MKRLLVVMLLLAGRNGFAQTSNVRDYVEALRAANAKHAAQEWAQAVPLWERVVQVNPVNGEYWTRLARAYYMTRAYRKSTAAYEKQLELGHGLVANAAYNIACNYALIGDKESALKWLGKALELKYENLHHAQTDEDLKLLRDDPRFREMLGLLDTSSMSRDQGWRTDLRFLAGEVKRRGWHLFPRLMTESAFDHEVARIHDAIPKLTDAEIEVEMMRLMRKIGDAHSGLLGARRNEFMETIPVQFKLFEEGLFITAAAPEHAKLVGMQVLEFGEREISDVVNRIRALTTEDNSWWIKEVGPHRMRHLPLLHAAGIIPDSTKVILRLRDDSGNEQVATLKTDLTQPNIWNLRTGVPGWTQLPMTQGSGAPLYLRNLAPNYWFEHIADKKTVYFQFNSIRNSEQEGLRAFVERMMRVVEGNNVEKLIIDMRHNNGGNTTLVQPLIHALIRSKINQPGKLFVIIGRRTLSAAQNAATMLENETNATFVGEPTGSSPNFVGEEDAFVLPYSNIIANVSHLLWQTAGPGDERKWIAPTIYMPPTFRAYKDGRDPVLEAILAL